jgi:phosphopantothenate---cysteine ligase (CTP)
MRCVVTAGPTIEPLDEVRRLTNFSTGRLGTELANQLDAADHDVILLLGEQATWNGANESVHTVRFSSTADLGNRLSELATTEATGVFHASAVSDFSFGRVWEEQAGIRRELEEGKITSRGGTLLAELIPTPKLIGELRGWFPHSLIVGWKYEVDGQRPDVIAKARMQIRNNRTDHSVANGRAYGEGFGLLSADDQLIDFSDRDSLIAGLVQFATAWPS